TIADALHQSGQRTEAGHLFADAERMQKKKNPKFKYLCSTEGFKYCDWLLAPAECACWQALIRATSVPPAVAPLGQDHHFAICAEVEQRGSVTLKWMLDISQSLIDIPLEHLTLARVGLIRAILTHALPQPTLDLPHVADAVNGFRNAGQVDYLPKGLLT